LQPILANTGAPKIGKMVIGTVKGDIHDIGKNLVAMMLERAGFEVETAKKFIAVKRGINLTPSPTGEGATVGQDAPLHAG